LNGKRPSAGGKSDADGLLNYHRRMFKDMVSLQKIASELDEVGSVDIMLEWYKGGGDDLPRPLQMKTLLEAFEKGILAHFREETVYIQELERYGDLKTRADALRKEHEKFTEDIAFLRRQLEELLPEKPETVENLESWKLLLHNLRELLRQIGNHAMWEQEAIFQLRHNV